MKRIIGRGWLYKRPDSKYWWVGYKLEGEDKPVQESTKCERKRDAEEVLKQIELRYRAPELAGVIAPTTDRLTFAELFQMKLDDAKLNNRQTRALKTRRHHLERFFADYHADDINDIAIMKYRSERKSVGAQVSTINRELQALRSAFNVAIRLKRLRADMKPNFPMFDESHLVRQVTISPDEYARIAVHLPEYLKLPVRFYHASGWRRDEIAKLHKDEIVETLDGIAIRLPAERSKNRTSRLLPLAGELAEVVKLALAKSRDDTP